MSTRVRNLKQARADHQAIVIATEQRSVKRLYNASESEELPAMLVQFVIRDDNAIDCFKFVQRKFVTYF